MRRKRGARGSMWGGPVSIMDWFGGLLDGTAGGLRAGLIALSVVFGIFSMPSLAVESELERVEDRTVRVLSVRDPFARAWADNLDAVHERLGVRLEITLHDYEPANRAVAINAVRQKSSYDLIAVDSVWVGHYAALGVLTPFVGLYADGHKPDYSHFSAFGLESGKYAGELYALPVQPHPEVLVFRKSLLEALGESPPSTTDELVRLARRIETEVPGVSGICWNGARGAALGQQILHFAGAFGGRLSKGPDQLEMPRDAWTSALSFARDLVAASPPEIRDLAWDSRVAAFMSGKCGMSYVWGARTAMLEASNSPVAGDVGYVAAPVAPGVAPVTPVGAWLLAIPSNLDPGRMRLALEALSVLTSAESARLLIELGVSASARRDACCDPRFPVLALVSRLDELGQLTNEMRPSMREFQVLSEIIGIEAHAALFGSTPVESAFDRIHARIMDLMAQSR